MSDPNNPDPHVPAPEGAESSDATGQIPADATEWTPMATPPAAADPTSTTTPDGATQWIPTASSAPAPGTGDPTQLIPGAAPQVPPGQFPTQGQPGQFSTGQFPTGQFQNPGQPGQFPTNQFPTQGQPGQYLPPGQFPPVPEQVMFAQVPPGAPGFGAPVEPSHRRRNWLLAGLAVLVVAAVAITAIVAWTGRSDNDGGAGTAEAAALDVLAAATKRDTMAAVALIAPSEAGPLQQVLTNAQRKAEEAGVQEGGGTDGLLEGVTITTENVHTKVESLRSGLSRVTFTSGTITARFDPAKANQGLRELFGDDLESGEGTIDVADLRGRSNRGDAIDPFVMVVSEGGRWYVSPGYTSAEYAWRGNDQGEADYNAKPVDAKRYSSPEEAAAGFVAALSESVDANSIDPITAALPGYYGRMVAIYGAQVRDDLDLDEVHELRFSNGKYSSENKNGVTYVHVDRLDYSATAEGENVSGTIEGNCVTVEGERHCADDAVREELPGFTEGLTSDIGVVATKDDVGWHIDPVQTVVGTSLLSVDATSVDSIYRAIGIEGELPKMVAKIKPDASLVGTQSVTVTSGVDGRAVVDMDVRAGQPVTISISPSNTSSYVSFRVYSATEQVDNSDNSSSGSESRPFTFTPTTSGTVKIVVNAYDPNETVTLTRR
ncbi:hypothetical protein QSJ18_01675 [Gordonia sp. ABSL1-1]|uniref:hypothetical protein n=1 Tax=Gordonia sp. ABSL1-1 TaxID=3053923 RepID=UPI00257435EF|nr:hypothetical protein [Gordonia sp. ABSL1-1]MDL9935447.1 hypothetical protein [Gordonia sp. ABSL1-1]